MCGCEDPHEKCGADRLHRLQGTATDKGSQTPEKPALARCKQILAPGYGRPHGVIVDILRGIGLII